MDVTHLDNGLYVVFVDFHSRLEVLQRLIIGGKLCLSTCSVIQNRLNVARVELVKAHTLAVETDSVRVLASLEELACFFLRLLGLLHLLPKLHDFRVIGVDAKSLLQVLLAGLELARGLFKSVAIVHQDSTAPKEELSLVNKHGLNLRRVGDAVRHVVWALTDHRFKSDGQVLHGVSCSLHDFAAVKHGFAPITLNQSLFGKLFIAKELFYKRNFFFC